MQKEQKKLWNRLMAAWQEGVACHLYFARLYTQEYPEDMYGWIALADGLTSIAAYDQGMHALRNARRLASKDEMHLIYAEMGDFYKEKGDYRRAETWYKRAVDLKGTDSNLVRLGACLAKQGAYKEAKKYHRRAIKTGSRVVDEAYFNLGLILRAEGKYAEALKCFEQAIEIDPKYTLAKEARKDILALFKAKKGI